MEHVFQLEMLTPTTAQRWDDVQSLEVPAETGRLTVLAHHMPLVCLLRAGRVTLRTAAGKREERDILSGWLQVRPDGVRLLTERATQTAPPK
jgi:F-type H+-transporting ATPase subunit epsilon